ncbi:hypothetical protein [Burkholderia cenocepacia]|uniref:Uncharacterized protein n=2 Tax=Burkholderia cepacia complex TaxID=87882 RepID=A0A1V2VV75_9BURK|nr:MULTISPECIES: hypothetical protein [Burkholderia cepacia complex]MCA8013583.1 hypothetical protein [Burkholderia vietnamiensis]MCW5142214.1 hypothetical protein [Burkholderia cenocepacia]ONU48687.1 hypothetical protein A8E66_03665 [Burkholderia cenocepacia]ONU49934.1 hypothetical protein A8E67_38755 [Burkholderia cenocepacia]ONU51627.1 hypothetical protein A8E62_25685 [Burkholderia cenocepacia]
MSRRNWKRIQPHSLRHALELCKEHARERRNLSVERISEHMGLADHWTLYKWFQSGRMPISLIRPFEDACGADFVTRWVAASAGRLIIDIPTGRDATAEDMQILQRTLNAAVGQLLDFYAGSANADETIATIQQAMEGLAWHRGNVERHVQPELDLGASE